MPRICIKPKPSNIKEPQCLHNKDNSGLRERQKQKTAVMEH